MNSSVVRQPTNISSLKYGANLRKGLAVLALGMLMLGYVGINLFEMVPSSILLIRAGAMLAIILLLMMDNLRNKINIQVFLLGLISVLGAATSFVSLNILFICVFVWATRSVSLRFVALASTWILGLTIITTLMLIYFGVVENAEDVVGQAAGLVDISSENRTRMTFGYKNVNAFAALVGGFCLLFMFVGKRPLVTNIISLLIAYVFYLYTDSRTMLMACISYVLFTIVFVQIVKHRRIFKMVSGIFLGVPIILTVASAAVVNQFPLIDLVFSGRFSFVSNYISSIPIYRLLIGGGEPSLTLTVDNSFALLFGALGVPIFFYFLHRLLFRLNQCANDLDFSTYSFLLSFCFYSFSESNMVRPESIICMIFWMAVLNPISAKSSEVKIY